MLLPPPLFPRPPLLLLGALAGGLAAGGLAGFGLGGAFGLASGFGLGGAAAGFGLAGAGAGAGLGMLLLLLPLPVAGFLVGGPVAPSVGPRFWPAEAAAAGPSASGGGAGGLARISLSVWHFGHLIWKRTGFLRFGSIAGIWTSHNVLHEVQLSRSFCGGNLAGGPSDIMKRGPRR